MARACRSGDRLCGRGVPPGSLSDLVLVDQLSKQSMAVESADHTLVTVSPPIWPGSNLLSEDPLHAQGR